MAFLTNGSVYVSLTSQHRFSDIVAAIVTNVDFLVSSPHGRPFHELQTNADCTQGSNDYIIIQVHDGKYDGRQVPVVSVGLNL